MVELHIFGILKMSSFQKCSIILDLTIFDKVINEKQKVGVVFILNA